MIHLARILILGLVLTSASAFPQGLLHSPETVVYDPVGDRYFVSNMRNPSYIVEIDHDGSYSIFSSITSFPHGMKIVDNVLYVSTNYGSQGGVIGFDLNTGEVVFEWLADMWFNDANGITADTSGNLYVAIMNSSLYRINLSTGESLRLPINVYLINGPHFDARSNRIIIPGEEYDWYLYTIDVATLEQGLIPVTYGKYACITEDQLHNFYVSSFFDNKVMQFDSSFSSEGVMVSAGQGPEGICFDQTHSTLVIPNLLADSLTFLPMDIELWCTSDNTIGWGQTAVNFEGFSIFDIDQWTWDFGDGNIASGPTPSHIYSIPGLYDVKMQAVTTAGDTLSRIYPRHVFCLADSVWAEQVQLIGEGPVEIAIHLQNHVPVREIRIPVEYSGDIGLVFDSFSVAGCRSEGYGLVQRIDFDEGQRRMTFLFKPRNGSPLYEKPGNGPMIKLYFTSSDPTPGQETIIDLCGYGSEYMPQLTANGLTYAPGVRNGKVEYSYVCGDANSDSNINVADAVFLINFVFKGGLAPSPLEAGDANGDGQTNVADAVYLINYVFKGGPGPRCV